MCPCVEAVQPYHAISGALPFQMLMLSLSFISVVLIHLQLSQRCVYSMSVDVNTMDHQIVQKSLQCWGSGVIMGYRPCQERPVKH